MGTSFFVGVVSCLVLAAVVGCDSDSNPTAHPSGFGGPSVPPERFPGRPVRMPSELDPVEPPKAGGPDRRGPAAQPIGTGGPGPMIGVADQTVSGIYRSEDGSSAEVAGVCKLTEDGFVCWKQDGTPNKDLAAQLKKNIDGKFSDFNFNIRYNRKNRIVVAKVKQAMTTVGSLGVIDAGGAFGTASQVPITLPSENPSGPRQAWTHYEIRGVAEVKSAKTTVLRLSETALVDSRGTLIPCQEKAEGNIAEEGYRVVSIRQAAKGTTSTPAPSWWAVRLQRVRKDKRNMQVNAIPCDMSGRPITYVDSEGNPVPAEVYQKAMADLRAHPRVPGSDVRSYRFADVRVMFEDGTTDLTMNIDPAKVSRLKLIGRYVKRIDLIGIPLDPK